MPIIDFLNKNDGAITTITTLVLVGITLWYVIETMRMRRTTQEMLKVSNTPEVQVSLLYEHKDYELYDLHLCIQNIGTGFAYDVEFSGTFTSFQPEMSDVPLGEYLIVKNGISYLGPGKRHQLGLLWNYKEELFPKEPFSIDVTYRDTAKNKIEKTFPLDFKKFDSYPQIGDPSLDSIAESLQRIDRTLSDMRTDLNFRNR